MSYTINQNKKTGILEVQHFGELNLDEITAARNETVQFVKRESIGRILVDLLQGKPGLDTWELFEFNASYLDVLPRDTMIAVLYSMKSASSNDAKFSENVATNRGVRMRVFTSDKDSLNWLNPGRYE